MTKYSLPALLIASSLTLGAQSLNDTLDARKTEFLKRASAEVAESQVEALRELEQSGIYEKVLKVGDKAPDFTLGNQNGKEVRLFDLLKKGPVVLT